MKNLPPLLIQTKTMILLDSHIFYWLATGRPDLGRHTRRLIEEAREAYVSALTVLELQGKILRARLPEIDLLRGIEESNLTHLPFTAEDARAIEHFPMLKGHDPIDVALLAQARNNRLDFVTADRRLLALQLPWVIDATQ